MSFLTLQQRIVHCIESMHFSLKKDIWAIVILFVPTERMWFLFLLENRDLLNSMINTAWRVFANVGPVDDCMFHLKIIPVNPQYISANVAHSILMYLDMLNHLCDKSNINTCLVMLSHQYRPFIRHLGLTSSCLNAVDLNTNR